MTKKKYCLTHEPIATHDYYRMQIHGIEYDTEYGINGYVYISRIYQKSYCGKSKVMFHKVKINYDSDHEPFVIMNGRYFDGRRDRIVVYLKDFILYENNYNAITCNELKALC